ncbi:hypothetical protein LRP67_05615 [Nocardioides sp. cx-169]|uniref:hypothetical protein n=1 Tax=Nocardioides sp. cx-169 TaxID=2899080 RepID=UPI001E47D522|nr:hypothetical protein [Nocardioides sp. cx-169]MCD4533553.1 hypothetical protein [Nocardioides sp. cx-169]
MASKRERENAAANAVVQQLTALTGGAVRGCLHDDNSRDHMHDFTITTEADTIALEVTTIADGKRVGRDHRWNRATLDDWVDVPGLTGCWLAHHAGVIEADTAIDALQTHLPALETLGIEQIHTPRWQQHAFAPASLRPPEWEAARALDGAGFSILSRVTDATAALLDEHGGQVWVARGFAFSRPADRNLPATLVSEELREDHLSDVHKLLAADNVTSRHLWLWVELTEGFAMLRSFETQGLPEVGVDIDGIDGVWLGRSPAAGSVAGYVWLRQHGWSEFSGTRNESDLGAC